MNSEHFCCVFVAFSDWLSLFQGTQELCWIYQDAQCFGIKGIFFVFSFHSKETRKGEMDIE